MKYEYEAQGRTEVQGESLSHCLFFHHKFHVDRHRIEHVPPQ
jgi:hypothetical protein